MYTFVPIGCQDSTSATAEKKTMLTMVKDGRGHFEDHLVFKN